MFSEIETEKEKDTSSKKIERINIVKYGVPFKKFASLLPQLIADKKNIIAIKMEHQKN